MSMRWSRVSWTRNTSRGCLAAHRVPDDPSDGEQRENGDDSLRDHAVKAPYAEDFRLDVGKVESEGHSDERGDEQKATATKQGENSDQQIADDPDAGDGEAIHQSVGAVVHDSAVPFLVDAAGRGLGTVVHAQGQR